MQMQLAISHEPTVKVPWGPSVQGAGAQSPGRHGGWRYPYTHKDWGAQATPQPPPSPRGELLEMEKQECIEYPESQETGRDEDTTALSARGGEQAGPQPITKGRAAQPSISNEGGRAKKGKRVLLRRGLLQYSQEEAHIFLMRLAYLLIRITFFKFTLMFKNSKLIVQILCTKQQIHKIYDGESQHILVCTLCTTTCTQ